MNEREGGSQRRSAQTRILNCKLEMIEINAREFRIGQRAWVWWRGIARDGRGAPTPNPLNRWHGSGDRLHCACPSPHNARWMNPLLFEPGRWYDVIPCFMPFIHSPIVPLQIPPSSGQLNKNITLPPPPPSTFYVNPLTFPSLMLDDKQFSPVSVPVFYLIWNVDLFFRTLSLNSRTFLSFLSTLGS